MCNDEWNETTLVLVQRAKMGDIDARDRLWNMVKPSLLRMFGRYLRRVRIADGDPIGFCYLAFDYALRMYDPARGMMFVPYCHQILKYRLCEFVTRSLDVIYNESLLYDLVDSDEASDEDPFSRLCRPSESHEDEVVLLASLSSLGEQAKQVGQRLMEGHTHTEVMRELKIPKTSYYRIIRVLRRFMEDSV